MQYLDGLGHIYDVPVECVDEFERRRGMCLKLAVVIKLLILTAIIYFFWL